MKNVKLQIKINNKNVINEQIIREIDVTNKSDNVIQDYIQMIVESTTKLKMNDFNKTNQNNVWGTFDNKISFELNKIIPITELKIKPIIHDYQITIDYYDKTGLKVVQTNNYNTIFKFHEKEKIIDVLRTLYPANLKIEKYPSGYIFNSFLTETKFKYTVDGRIAVITLQRQTK